ncbi:MAG: RNA polymerase sigma factor [Pseudohongiellaceae bacterium]
MTNESLLIFKAVTRQDNDAFSSLVRMHQGKIRAYLMRLCKSYDLADDIAQETFLTAFRKLHSFKGEGNFSGWLFSIAHNCFLQHIRKTKRRSDITQQFSSEQEIHAEKYDEICTEQMDLEQALRNLNADETATITLCHSFGFSHQEVSDILSMPLGSVKSNISRGKTKLTNLLTAENGLEKAS